MSETSTAGGQTSNFSVLYVIIGGAAFFATVVLPVAFLFVLRRLRLRSQSSEQQLGPSGVIAKANPQQEEPKLFDIYVKPGLEVHEAKFEYVLPLAVRPMFPQHAPPVTDALSTSPSVLRLHHQSRSRDQEVHKAEAPIHQDPFNAYDVAVLIAMPHPHAPDHWNELGEYVIGNTKLVPPASQDDLIPF